MDPRHTYPRFTIASLLGDLAFLPAWTVALMRPSGWQIAGPIFLVAFPVLRVGGMWLYASRQPPDATPRARRTAIFTTVLALVAVGLWLSTVLRGPRSF